MKDKLTGNAATARNESETIARTQQGDATAFECLYKAHCKHVFSPCLKMLKNSALTRDFLG